MSSVSETGTSIESELINPNPLLTLIECFECMFVEEILRAPGTTRQIIDDQVIWRHMWC